MTRLAAHARQASPATASGSASAAARTPSPADAAIAAADPSTPIPALLCLAAQHPGAVLRNPVFDVAMVADPNLLLRAGIDALVAMVESDAADPAFLRRVAAIAVRPGSTRVVDGREHRTSAKVMPGAAFALAARADCPRDLLEAIVAHHPGSACARCVLELAQARLAAISGGEAAWGPAVTAALSVGCSAPPGAALPPDVTVAFARHGLFDPDGPSGHAHAILTDRSLRMAIVATVAGSPPHRRWLAAAARAEVRGGDVRMSDRDASLEIRWRWRGFEPSEAGGVGFGFMAQNEAIGWSATNRQAEALLQRWQAGDIVDGSGTPWKFPTSHRDLSLEQAEELALRLPESARRTSASMLLLCSPRCPIDRLRERARHADWLVRLCVAFNRATPPAERAALQADRNWLVRRAAQEGGRP
jgi:hypothetical protein